VCWLHGQTNLRRFVAVIESRELLQPATAYHLLKARQGFANAVRALP
jgi:hypothetical protein